MFAAGVKRWGRAIKDAYNAFAMIAAASLAKRVWRTLNRVFPKCTVLAQATAFNLFLAFFPTLLIAVALATSRVGGKTSLLDLITDLTKFLPPGSQQIVGQFLIKRGPEAWKIALVGWTGTLLAGTQVMKLLMQGIHVIHNDNEDLGFLRRQLRGLLLFLITIAPLLAATILGVFGRPLRHWLGDEIGKHTSMRGLWAVFFPAVAFLFAMVGLAAIYRAARPHAEGLRRVLPGALLATTLWWLVDLGFGFYVRRVPYSIVYGGLAAVVGMMIWMELSVVVVFLGAAWNAELADARRESRRA
jgi:membrane protein